MDDEVNAVRETYHVRLREEEAARRESHMTPRAGDWSERQLLAVGPDTGRLIAILARSLDAPTILEMATKAGLADHIDFKVGDAVGMIGEPQVTVDFVLVDPRKNLYVPCLETFLPKLDRDVMIVADNMLQPGGETCMVMVEPSARMPGSAACCCLWERELKSAGSSRSEQAGGALCATMVIRPRRRFAVG